MNETDEPEDVLLTRAIANNDTAAYEILRVAYLDHVPGDFLPVAIEMAKKNKYQPAYFDTYYAILNKNDIWGDADLKITSINMPDRELALEYLILGAKAGDEGAIEELKKHYSSAKSSDKRDIFSVRLTKVYGAFLDSLYVDTTK